MSNKNILKVRNVKKYFHTPQGVLKAIDDVSFDVKEGKIVGLIGESGSGKTTVGRCLIRLYEDYSGLVQLDGKVISGKKLTKNKKLFLHQSMQMIFQDPHASLNGQHNIFTILKEPLVVNKIMHKEYQDFFNDWKDVKENFHYSFLEFNAKLELDTYLFRVKHANAYLKEWNNFFDKLKFKFIDIDNDFNLYFSFLDNRQIEESKVIAKMFENNAKLINFYYKKQDEYRKGEILAIENKIKLTKEELKKVEQLTKNSKQFLNLKEQLQKEKKLYNNEKKQYKEYKLNNLNLFDSYVNDLKNDYFVILNKLNQTKTIKDYNSLLPSCLIAKHCFKNLKKYKKQLIFLEDEMMDDLINKLKDQKNNLVDILEEKYKENCEKNIKKRILNDIESNFNFNFDKFILISNKNKNKFIQNIQKLENNIIKIKDKINSCEKQPQYSENDYLNVKKKLEKALEENEIDLANYIKDFNKRMDKLTNQISKAKKELNSLSQEINFLNEKFNQVHENFIKGLTNYFLNKSTNKKDLNAKINIYKNKVNDKLETIRAFEIEIKNIFKDQENIFQILGINEPKNIFKAKFKQLISKYTIKKVLLKEKIYSSLEEVGLLRQFAWRYPHEFSGGQRQRIVIARALISKPKIIIADEPIASLDVSIQAQIVNLLKQLCEKNNVSLVFVAHDLSMVEYIADEVLIMHLGKIVESGSCEEIYKHPKHPYTINLFNSMPKISNANKGFENVNFSLDYLNEQQKKAMYCDFFKINDNHFLYGTLDQVFKWSNKIPKICEFTNNKKLYEQQIKKIEINNSKI